MATFRLEELGGITAGELAGVNRVMGRQRALELSHLLPEQAAGSFHRAGGVSQVIVHGGRCHGA